MADAAHVLRIQEHYLEALEEGRFDQIPGSTYAIGFLRSYAGFLGLDPDEIIDAFKREQGLDKSEQRLAFPSPSDTSPKPKFWLILLVLVLAGLAYGGWQYQSTGGQIATDLVDDVSTRLTEAVGMGETDVAAGGHRRREPDGRHRRLPLRPAPAPATETTAETASWRARCRERPQPLSRTNASVPPEPAAGTADRRRGGDRSRQRPRVIPAPSLARVRSRSEATEVAAG